MQIAKLGGRIIGLNRGGGGSNSSQQGDRNESGLRGALCLGRGNSSWISLIKHNHVGINFLRQLPHA